MFGDSDADVGKVPTHYDVVAGKSRGDADDRDVLSFVIGATPYQVIVVVGGADDEIILMNVASAAGIR